MGNCDDLSMMNLALNCWFSQCCNMLTARLSPCYSTYLLFNLWLNNRTITRFIADDKVVYQWVKLEMRLASETAEHDVVWSIWAGGHCELSCAHLNGEWQFHAKSVKLISAFLACHPDWTQGPPLLCAERGLAFKFPTLAGKFTRQCSSTIPLWQTEIFNQNCICLQKFHDFV